MTSAASFVIGKSFSILFAWTKKLDPTQFITPL